MSNYTFTVEGLGTKTRPGTDLVDAVSRYSTEIKGMTQEWFRPKSLGGTRDLFVVTYGKKSDDLTYRKVKEVKKNGS